MPERGAAIAQICTSSSIAISAAGLAIVPTMTRSALASVTIERLDGAVAPERLRAAAEEHVPPAPVGDRAAHPCVDLARGRGTRWPPAATPSSVAELQKPQAPGSSRRTVGGVRAGGVCGPQLARQRGVQRVAERQRRELPGVHPGRGDRERPRDQRGDRRGRERAADEHQQRELLLLVVRALAGAAASLMTASALRALQRAGERGQRRA